MRFYLNTNTFISVIQEDNKFSCQVMDLRYGVGFASASVTDGSEEIISCIVNQGFYESSKICNTIQEVAEYHLQCLIDIYVFQNS